MFFKKIIPFALDLIFPIKCLGCGKEGQYLCQKCFSQIPFLTQYYCLKCHKQKGLGHLCWDCQKKTSLKGVIAAGSYDHPLLKKAIHTFKYRYVESLALPLAQFFIHYLKTVINLNGLPFPSDRGVRGVPFPPGDKEHEPDIQSAGRNNSQCYVLTDEWLSIPIPLHKKKLKERGFNQAALLAQELQKSIGGKIQSDVLIRQRPTLTQTNLDLRSRKENIKNAFALKNKNTIAGKSIFLIDDVVTSGTTLFEAASVLKKGGAKDIWGLTIAKG